MTNTQIDGGWDALAARFEAAWREAQKAGGPPPALDAYLPTGGDRLPALIELLHYDIEYRILTGSASTLDDCLRKYPELNGTPEAVEKLRRHEMECRARSRKGILEPGTRLGDYEIQERVASGGMGDVYRAFDASIKRPVALKVLRSIYAADSPMAARFVEESRITGQLQHPGIPPIYRIGVLPDGRPFLAMKLIQGETLQGLIQSKSPINHLAVFESVSQAVGYAHRHGIIHRDLKPQNIMVGSFGEVQVMDWGLAKSLGSATFTTEGDGSAAATVIQLAGDTPGTRVGSMIGTPGYMPPEQATGDSVRIDRRSDVYGLGAVLHAMLTGDPPKDKPSLETCAAEPELVALCGRCLAGDPAARPEDANAVAREVAGIREAAEARARNAELETARVEVEAAGQTRRRRQQLVMGGGIVAASLLGAAIAGWQWRRAAKEESNTRLALGEVRSEQIRTTAAMEELITEKKNTLLALNAMTDNVVEKLIGSQLVMNEAQKSFLQYTISLYEKAAARRGDSPETRLLRIEGFFRVAKLQEALGLFDESIANYLASRNLLIAYTETESADSDHRHNLATCRNNLGALYERIGRLDLAEQEIREALALRKILAKSTPLNSDYQSNLANSHNTLGNLMNKIERLDLAESEYISAREIQRALVAAFPDERQHRQHLATSLNNLGVVYHHSSRWQMAENVYREGLDLRKVLADKYADVPEYCFALADSHGNLGSLFSETDRRRLAEIEFRAAYELRKGLTAAFPAIPMYRKALAASHYNLGNLLRDTGQDELAMVEYRSARDLQTALADSYPKVLEYRSALAASHNNLGLLLSELVRGDFAQIEYHAARDLQKALVEELPASPEFRNDLAGTLVNWATLMSDCDKPAHAQKLLHEAAVHHKVALRIQPNNMIYRQFFRNNRFLLLRTSVTLGDHIAIMPLVTEVMRYSIDRRNDSYDCACQLANAISTLTSKGKLEDEWAGKFANEAVSLLKQSIGLGFNDVRNLDSDPDLAPLRDREDFKQLLAALKAKEK